MTDPTHNGRHTGPTADEIAGLVSAERTAGEYVPVPGLANAGVPIPEPRKDLALDELAPDDLSPDDSAPAPFAPDDPAPNDSAPDDGSSVSAGSDEGTPEGAAADQQITLDQGTGNAAIAAAEVRAKGTRWRNIADVPPLPIPRDTANVRSGPEVHPACLSLLPLVGVWRGTGLFGNDPDLKTPQFGQQITIAHDGRPFLTYESVSWLLDPDGAVTGPGAREVGFWRPQPDGSIELMVAHAEGRIELFYGRPRSIASWALSTDAVVRTPTAVPVVGSTRLYGITPDGRLAYVEERAHTDIELAPHASAALDRLTG